MFTKNLFYLELITTYLYCLWIMASTKAENLLIATMLPYKKGVLLA